MDASLPNDQGLSTEEAAARRKRYGPNAIEEKRQSLLLEVGSHFWGPIPWMIELALSRSSRNARGNPLAEALDELDRS